MPLTPTRAWTRIERVLVMGARSFIIKVAKNSLATNIAP